MLSEKADEPEDSSRGGEARNVSAEFTDAEQDARPDLPLARFCALALGLNLGLLISFMDSSIVATSLYTISNEFEDMNTVNWVALAYTLCYLTFAVFFARLSDVIGRRSAFMLAYTIFFAFSLGCGFAQSMQQLIACRALQGIGGSGLYSCSMIIFLEVTPNKWKHFLPSLIGVVVAVGGVLGPVLGGIISHYTTWRWIFWINPIGFFSASLFYLAWPPSRYLPAIERRTWRELDYLGSFLLIAAAVLVVFPFQNASRTGLWGEAVFIAPLVFGVVCWFALFGWEMFIEKYWGDGVAAALPMRLFRNRMYVAGVLTNLFLGFPFILLIYAFPLRLQVVNGKSSLLAGIMLLPMLASSAVGSVLAGAINRRVDRTCETQVLAACLVALGCGLLSTLSSSYELEPKALGFLVFCGLGFGLAVAAATMVGNLQASVRDHSPAQGILAQIRVLGGSLGIAMSSAVLGTTLRSQLAGVVDFGLLNSLERVMGELSPAQAAAVRQAYSDAFSQYMKIGAIIACVSIPLALLGWTRERLNLLERIEHNDREEMLRSKAAKTGEQA